MKLMGALAALAVGCSAASTVPSEDGTTTGTDPTDQTTTTMTPPTSMTPTGSGSESGSGSSSESGDPETSSSSSSGGEESSSSSGGEEVFDCADIPDEPLERNLMDGPRGYHGLVITPDGEIIGTDGSSLIASTYEGDWRLFMPGYGYGEQMDWLADGDIVASTENGAISRITLDATSEVIRASVWAYGVRRGLDDRVYVANNNTVARINPNNGNRVLLFSNLGDQPHSIGWSPDGTRMYVGTIALNDPGTVYFADFDEDMNQLDTELRVLTNEVHIPAMGGSWHDAVAVDACGNLYIPDYYSSNMFRVTPGGTVTLYWVPNNQSRYAHGAVWGTGEHGWRSDALYVPQPYNNNTVTEIVVGVPSREFTGTVLNAEEPLK